VVLKLFLAADPFSLHHKPLRTASFCQRCFEYREIRFGRFMAWAPQPPRQEANFKILASANCRHQHQIKRGQSTCNMKMSDYSCDAIKLNIGPNERIKTSRFSWLGFGLRTPENKFMNAWSRGSQPLLLGVNFTYPGVNSMMLKLQYFVLFYSASE